MMPKVEFATLEQLLLSLGFTADVTPRFVRFAYPGTDLTFHFKPYAGADEVDAVDVFTIHKVLDERGILPWRDVERRLSPRPVAG